MQYENFVIQITTDARDAVVLRVSESSVGESAAVFAIAEGPLDRLIAQSRASPEALDRLLATQGPEEVGQQLYEALISGPIQRRFLEAIGRASSAGADGVRIKIQVDFESAALAEVHALPWEYLYRVETGTFLALDRRLPVVRHLRLPVTRNRPVAPSRLKLLVAVAAPSDCQQLESTDECRRITASWQDYQMDVRLLTRATLDRIRACLVAETFHGLHFIGHGRLDPVSGDGQLLLEDRHGRSAPCSGRDLAIQLNDRTALRWVFLNACSTSNATARRPFGGLAAALLRTGIPAVLAMQRPVSDQAAVVFSQTVYQRLAAGEGIDTAVSEGRLAIHRSLPGSVEWGTPVLFLQAADGELFRRMNAPSTPDVTADHESTDRESTDRESSDPRVALGTDGGQKDRRYRRTIGLVLLVIVLIALSRLDFSPTRPPTEDAGSVAARTADRWHVITVGEGIVAEIPAFDARVSVTFDSLGVPFARLTVTLPGHARAMHKTVMGPTTMVLDDRRSLSIQSIDWNRREVSILPIRPR